MPKTTRKSAEGSRVRTGGSLYRRAPTVLVAVAVLGVVGLLILSFVNRGILAGGGAATGKAAPEVTFQVYEGPGLTPDVTMKLSELRGKPVVLNFWAGLCPPCRAEMPDFQRIAQRYEGQVALVGIDIGPFVGLGSNADARKLLSDLGHNICDRARPQPERDHLVRHPGHADNVLPGRPGQYHKEVVRIFGGKPDGRGDRRAHPVLVARRRE